LSIGKAIGIAVLTAVIVMAVGIWWSRQQLDVPVPTAAPSAAPSASTTTRGPTTRASQTPVTTRSSAAPIASTSAVPSAEPSAAEPPADPASSDEGGDGSELPPTLGYLQVKFNGEQGGEVFVFAKSYGPVGQKLKVPCNRPAFVRIGKTPGPRWITKGKTVSIACQKVTVTFISP